MTEKVQRFRMKEYRAVIKEMESQDSTTVSQEFLERAKKLDNALDTKIVNLYGRAKGSDLSAATMLGLTLFSAAIQQYHAAIGWGIAFVGNITFSEVSRHVAGKREKQQERLHAGLRRLDPLSGINVRMSVAH